MRTTIRTTAVSVTAVLGLVLGALALAVGSGATSSAQAAGAWTSETVAGMNLRLYVPTTAPAITDGRALMVNLHGCVQTNSDLVSGGNWQATADAYGMVVAIPAAPNGGVIAGCWDYYDGQHSRSAPARHDDNLLDLVSTLLARPGLALDPDQVYVSGLSSGGGETMVMGCLAPDVFAGVGINAGPTVGTTSSQISSVSTTKSAATATCRSFAGSHTDGFDTQVASVIHGNDDYTVATGYNRLNAEVLAGIYGAGATSAVSMSTLPGSNTAGSGTQWADATGPRVSLLTNTGLGHNWPAGGGPGGRYIKASSINYPAYVTAFFFANNRRVDGQTPTSTPTPTGTPTPTPTPTGTPTTPPAGQTCWTTSNASHESAGRAVSYGNNPYNPFYALGSQDYLGQGNTTVTSVSKTGEGTFRKVASC